MREFLLETYPDIFADPTSIILDVAGGKGDLSWLLCNVSPPAMNSVIVVDPRIPKHSHLLKSIQYLRHHPEQARERAVPNQPSHQPLAGLLAHLRPEPFHEPQHLRLLVNDELVQAVRHYQMTTTTTATTNHHGDVTATADWTLYYEQAMQQACEKKNALGYREDDGESRIMSAENALSVLLQTRLIVGFHPDQATEACIDLALLLHIPYCIVPCCVFPSEFPHRRHTLHGRVVKTHAELVEYLLEHKGADMKRAVLKFHETNTARNVVLYRQ